MLSNWGPCGQQPDPPSVPDVLDEAGLTFDDWLDFLERMANGSTAEQENYACWMEHYWTVHYLEVCLCSPNCPDDDPWGGH